MKQLFGLILFLLVACSLWAQAMAPKEVTVFGQKIHYLEAGSGPNVILLHGLGADGTYWTANVPALAKSFHVYAPDQVGFGQSDKPLIDYRIATLVDFLDGFCKKVGIEKATVVGNSLGGWTAMAFTLAHPEKVDRMVLVDSAGYSFEHLGGTKPSRQTLAIFAPATLQATKFFLGLVFANKSLVTDQFAEAVFTAHLSYNDGYTVDRFIDSMLRGEDFIDGKLGAIKAPTLVIWGRQDMLIPWPAGQALAKDIAGSDIQILDHCGHTPQIECAEPFNTALIKFLSSTGGAGSANQ